MTEEYIKDRISLVNNRVSLKNYKKEINDLKFQRAILLVAFIGVVIFSLFRG